MFGLYDNRNVKKEQQPALFPDERVFKTSHNSGVYTPFSLNSKFDFNLGFCKAAMPTNVSAKEEELYENNGGTTLTISVDNKIIIASDTRHSSEYTINSRRMTKVFRIGSYFLTTVGFYADGIEVYSRLVYAVKQYETYDKMPLSALAHLLHNILYSRRFFPLYTYCCLSGFVDGQARIYSYDPVGSYQETKCRCDGTASSMIQPLLDSWISGKNFKGFTGISFEDGLNLVKKAFDAAAEIDVKTKDMLEIYTIDKENVHHEFVELRKD